MRANFLLLAFLLTSPATAQAQTHKACTVAQPQPQTSADEAFSKAAELQSKAGFDQARPAYAAAEALYAAQTPSPEATAGVVRAHLAQRKLSEALALAQRESATHPDNALLLDALGEVRFRRGEVEEAASAFNRSLALDPCAARTHFDVSLYLNLSGSHATAQAQLDLAHKLSPADPLITRVWTNSHAPLLTNDERIARIKQRMADHPDQTPDQQAANLNTIKALEAREKGDCQLVNPITSTKFLIQLMDNGAAQVRQSRGGADVFFNGQRRRLLLDTGAGGITLTRSAAAALHLEPEAEVSSFGFGDNGARPPTLTHVESIKIGQMEFHNCMVRILEDKNTLNFDGLLGGDVFSSFLLTLDFPASEVRLSPLPTRPGQPAQTATLSSEGDTSAHTLAELRQDRYIAPEMKDWIRIFRSGHQLIFPTLIGNTASKLFIMDTGSGNNLISTEAAREVTHVESDQSHHVRGISGNTADVKGTGPIDLSFGGVKQETNGLTAVDLSNFSRSSGVEISGFLGYFTLHELVIQIDYRDNLVHLTYTPHVGSGAR